MNEQSLRKSPILAKEKITLLGFFFKKREKKFTICIPVQACQWQSVEQSSRSSQYGALWFIATLVKFAL